MPQRKMVLLVKESEKPCVAFRRLVTAWDSASLLLCYRHRSTSLKTGWKSIVGDYTDYEDDCVYLKYHTMHFA